MMLIRMMPVMPKRCLLRRRYARELGSYPRPVNQPVASHREAAYAATTNKTSYYAY